MKVVIAVIFCMVTAAMPSFAGCTRNIIGNLNCDSMSDLIHQQNQDMNNIIGGTNSSISSRPNPMGGYNYSNGISSRPNPLGGYDYSNGMSCRPNPLGGMDCR
jgi:hypothetical protein